MDNNGSDAKFPRLRIARATHTDLIFLVKNRKKYALKIKKESRFNDSLSERPALFDSSKTAKNPSFTAY